LDIALALLLTLLACACWGANLLGLPGNWGLVALGTGCWALLPPDYRSYVAATPLMVIVAVAVIGEIFELIAGALGASRLGGSRRGALLAVAGSFAGGLLGLALGAPIPVIGSIVAALIGSGLGALAGAVIGERWVGKDWEQSLQVGRAAFWGRLLGTLAKAFCGTIAAVVFVVAIWL
jgi:uncharacterized protein